MMLRPLVELGGAGLLLWFAGRGQLRLKAALARCAALRRAALALIRRDPLTGLADRRALDLFLDESCGGGTMTLLHCRLGNLGPIADGHGPHAVDTVLRKVAARLTEVAVTGGEVLLVRGDVGEFALAAGPGADDSHLADRVADALAAPVVVRGAEISVEALVGRAHSVPGDSAAALLDRAAGAARPAPHVEAGTVGSEGRRLLERPLAAVAADGVPVYAAVVGIERWPSIRATIGYALAGTLLREVGERIAAELGGGAAVEQISADLLAVGFAAAEPAEAERIVAAIRSTGEGPATVGGHSVDLCVAIGYAGPGAFAELRELTEQARLAHDQARRTPGREVRFSAAAFGDPLDRLALMRDLRRGLGAGEFTLLYQPKLRVATGAIDSVEALIRWHHPTRGQVPTEEFVTLAEETGDIRAMTEWVLAQAVAEQAEMAAAGLDLFVYVNISARLVADGDFTRELLRLVLGAGGRIGVEITETAVIDDPEHALANLHALAQAGVRLAIDDYGSGMSSLAYLKQLPAHELKIDRLFVQGLTDSHRDPMIVRSTIDLAHGLGLEVTAEGVDTASSLALLQVMRCDLIQGYIVAKPMPLAELIAFCAAADEEVDDAAQPRSRADRPGFVRHDDFWASKPSAA